MKAVVTGQVARPYADAMALKPVAGAVTDSTRELPSAVGTALAFHHVFCAASGFAGARLG